MHATVLVLGEDVEALMDPYSEHDPEAVEQTWDWCGRSGTADSHRCVGVCGAAPFVAAAFFFGVTRLPRRARLRA